MLEAKRQQSLREVTLIVGWCKGQPIHQTFVVMNSVVTESSDSRVQKSSSPWS
jgi:hypothetical protein